MAVRRVALYLLVAALLAPSVAPLGGAQDATEWYANVNQPLVLPGSDVAVSLSGNAGHVHVEALRIVAPERVTSWTDGPSALGELALLDERDVDLSTNEYGGWAAAQSVTFHLDAAGIYAIVATSGAQ